MKQIKFSVILLFIIMFSCSDNNENEKVLYSLTFEKDSYEVRVGLQNTIAVRSGNQHYTVTVDDADILEASSIIAEGTASAGEIIINAKKKGETFIYVTDNLTTDKVKLKVKVTDSYIANQVVKSNHILFSDNQFLYLVKNNDKDFYILTRNQSQDDFALKIKGNYEILVENKEPYLILNFQDSEKGNITYKFNFVDSSSTTFVIFNSFFELGWIAENTLRETSLLFLNLKEEGTNLEVSLHLVFSELMPEGILD